VRLKVLVLFGDSNPIEVWRRHRRNSRRPHQQDPQTCQVKV